MSEKKTKVQVYLDVEAVEYVDYSIEQLRDLHNIDANRSQVINTALKLLNSERSK